MFSATPWATLTYVSYLPNRPNFPHVPYQMCDETRATARSGRTPCNRWVTVRGPLIINLRILFLHFLTVATWSVVRFHGAEIAMFSVISNLCIFFYLVFFIRKAGRYTSSSSVSDRFPWREKQLRAGLSSPIFKLIKGSVLFT